LGLGKGGEGYIAPDDWCYNCGDCGHLGDDCGEVPHLADIPEEPSAFSLYNTMSGPFDHAPGLKASTSHHRMPRDWEQDRVMDSRSANVGREGRKRERARMEKKAKQLEANDDPDDWFGNQRNIKNRVVAPHRKGREVKKLSLVVKDTHFQPLPPVGTHQTRSLADRLGLGGDRDRGNSHGRYQDRRSQSGGKHSEDHNSSRRRSGGHERGNGDKYDRRDTGPRYKGGYSR